MTLSERERRERDRRRRAAARRGIEAALAYRAAYEPPRRRIYKKYYYSAAAAAAAYGAKRFSNYKKSWKSSAKPKTTTKTLAKAVRKIRTQVKSTTSTLTVRRRDTYVHLVPTNQSFHRHYNVNNTPNMEECLSTVPYFDVGTGAIVQKDLRDDQFQRGILFKTIYSDIRCVNNYKVPVNLRIYCCTPKIDTDINPDFAITNGIGDQMDSVQSLSTQLFPTDVTQFKDLWVIRKTKKIRLRPGAVCVMNHSVSDVSYDTSFVDDSSNDYQKTNKNFTWLVRAEGPIAHGAVEPPVAVGASNAGVDVCVDTKFVLNYDGGLQGAQRYRFIDNSDDVSAGVVTNMPTAVNTTYTALANSAGL